MFQTQDLADDLRHFLKKTVEDTSAPHLQAVTQAAKAEADLEAKPIKIVPKGLRSFDAHDADFFLELLPGPRDREGLPDSLRFWKTRIDETDPDNTFSVGPIYGPSGCGKSSLVKAGLLPRLSEDVTRHYALRALSRELFEKESVRLSVSGLRIAQQQPDGNFLSTTFRLPLSP
jgi:hypothetical protein